MRSCISINLRKDNIVIKVNEEYSQEDIVYTLRKKIPDLKNYIKASTHLL